MNISVSGTLWRAKLIVMKGQIQPVSPGFGSPDQYVQTVGGKVRVSGTWKSLAIVKGPKKWSTLWINEECPLHNTISRVLWCSSSSHQSKAPEALTSLWEPEVTERGLSCSDFSISSRKLIMLCSLASDSRAAPSGRAGWWLSWPWSSRLSVVRELESPSCMRGEGNVRYSHGKRGGLTLSINYFILLCEVNEGNSLLYTNNIVGTNWRNIHLLQFQVNRYTFILIQIKLWSKYKSSK